MFESTPISEPSCLQLAGAITRAERRLAKLERLSDIGMELAEQVGAHTAAAMAAVNEDKGGNPARAFATLSRSIRLTLALEARVDAQIIALRNGRVPAGWALGAPTARCGHGYGEAALERGTRAEPHPARENLVDRDPIEDWALAPSPTKVGAHLSPDAIATSQTLGPGFRRGRVESEREVEGELEVEGCGERATDDPASLPFMGRAETELQRSPGWGCLDRPEGRGEGNDPTPLGPGGPSRPSP